MFTMAGDRAGRKRFRASTGLTQGVGNPGSLALANTAVTPGAYTYTNLTVDQQGRLTAAANGTTPGPGTDPISSIYPVFTPGPNDDEFDGVSFSGSWTAVNSGSHLPTLVQADNCLSILHPGSDASGELHAWVKQPTITTGSYVQAGFRSIGFAQNFNLGGVLFADGSTYNSGTQCCAYESHDERLFRLEQHTGYKTQGTSNSDAEEYGASRTDLHVKLIYNGSNSFTSLVSSDGIQFVTVRTMTVTMTPTWAGFFVSTFSGTHPYMWTFRYCRFG